MIRVDYNQFDQHFCLLKTNPSMYTCLLTLCLCGDSFNLQHALSCPKGGLVITRHNELRNLTAEILREVCKNVVIKSLLTPLMGKELPKS